MGRGPSKRFDSRRAELLDSAWEVILEQGYEAATVNAFIEHAGASKGTFYHYFSSKDEVVDGVVERATRRALAEIEHEVTADSTSALEKLNRFLGISARTRPSATRDLRQLALQVRRSGNTALLERLRDKVSLLCSPPLERIIEQGVEEGVFDTPYPAEVAELLLTASDLALAESSRVLLQGGEPERMERELLRRTEFSAWVFERILGARRGTIERATREDVRLLVRLALEERSDHER